MTFSARFTEIRPTSQFSARIAAPRMFVLHGAAMTSLDGLSNMIVNGTRQVSAHGGFKDERGIGWVNEENRAWSLSDAYYDSIAYTLENANDQIPPYSFTGSTQESIAQWIADVARRTGIWPQRDGGDRTLWTVIGHSEVYTIYGGSYATACPQLLDLNWITTRAQNILLGDEETEEEMAQPLPSRVIRSDPARGGNGNIAMLHPAGWVLVGDPLMPDISSANGQALMAGQPKNGDNYWIDVSGDQFGWEINRHDSLRAKLDEHLKKVIGTPSGGGSTDLTPVLDAIAKIPTEEQNGAAARKAIVK